MKQKIIYTVFIVIFTLVSLEILLRIFHIDRTWSESVGHGYESYYGLTKKSWLYTYTPNSEFDIDNNEFKFHYKTNRLGIRERDTAYTDTAVNKILCLGDSYTEGLGAPNYSSYPRLLSLILNRQGFNNEVYDGGVAGSDPFYYYILLKQKLLQTKPGYVLATFNSSDIADYVFRGGMERFKPDGTVVYNKGPWFEKYYSKSYLVRLWVNRICGYKEQNLFVKKSDADRIYLNAVAQYAELFKQMQALADSNHFKLLVVIQPIAKEVTQTYTARDKRLNLAFTKMGELLQQQNVAYINMMQPLKKVLNTDNLYTYSYPVDVHFKPVGYYMFANELLKAIAGKYPTFFSNNDTLLAPAVNNR
jgi:lysophospholipase L1-like esterase